MQIEKTKVDRERELAMRYRESLDAGAEDFEARNELIEMHLPLIRWAAKKIHLANRQHTQLEELVDVGCTGMIRALRRFDPRTGYRISTYCLAWIRNALHEHVRDFRWNQYVPEKEYRLLMKMQSALSKMPTRFDGYIDFSSLANALRIEEAECHRLYSLSKAYVSIETPITKNGKLRLADRLPEKKDRSDSFVQAHELAADLIERALDDLPDDEREEIRKYYLTNGYYYGDYATEDTKNKRQRALRKLKKSASIAKARAAMAAVENR